MHIHSISILVVIPTLENTDIFWHVSFSFYESSIIFNHLNSSKIMSDIACHYVSIMEIRHLLLQLLHLRCPGHSRGIPDSCDFRLRRSRPWPSQLYHFHRMAMWRVRVRGRKKETADVIRYDRVIRSMVMLDYHDYHPTQMKNEELQSFWT